MRRPLLPALLALLIAPAALPAANDLTARLRVCAAMEDGASRLACYDKLSAAESAASPLASPDRALPPTAAPAVKEAPPEPSEEDLFGLSSAQVRELGIFDEDEEDEEGIDAQVTRVAALGKGKFNYYLDNGQVWQQKFRESGFKVRVGDTVRIRRSLFGGYRMQGKQDRNVQVRRIR